MDRGQALSHTALVDTAPADPEPSTAPAERPTDPSTYDAVDRGLVTLALVWQFLWIVGDARVWPTNVGGGLAPFLMWGSALAWLALAASHVLGSARWQWPLRILNVAALLAVSVAVLINAALQADPDWGAATSLAVLPGAMAGLLFPYGGALAWLLTSVTIEVSILFGFFDPSVASAAEQQDLLYPAYALAVGFVTLSARRALVRDARAVDDAATELIAAEQERLVAEGVESAVHREERLLHATVLNTLTAIVRGGLATSELQQRLRERCREAADVMRRLRYRVEPSPASHTDGRWLDRDLSDAIIDLYTAGTSVHADCDSLRVVPAPVYDAILTAAREALANVDRHADARTVWLEARMTASRGGQHARVVVRDDGRGFDPEDSRERFGMLSAMEQSLAEVGGTSSVQSSPGGGTTVLIEWDAPRTARVDPPFRPAARAFTMPILIAMGLFNALLIVLTRDEIQEPIADLAAFGIFVALGLLVAWASLAGEIPWWVVLVVAVASPLIYQLQTQSVVVDHGTWTAWASEAIIALFVVAAGAGPTWSWLVLVAMWLLIQGDVMHELLAPGTALIIASALFGRSTRRNAAAVAAARSQVAVEQAAVAVSDASVRRMSMRYGALRESDVTGLLEGIADGRIDPDDDVTRFHAALEERFIRTVIKVDPAQDAVHAAATSLAVRARRRGIFLDVDIPEVAPPWARTTALGRQSLRLAIDASEPGGVARLSARDESGIFAIRLITPISPDRQADMLGLPVPGALLDPAEPDMLWELRIANGG